MKKSLKHLIAFIVSTLYMLAVYFVIGIYFSTNDDRFMGELLSGSITGNPETHLVYVNYLLSLPLSLLYRISISVSWFGLLLIFLHWLSCYFILDSFYMKAKTKSDMGIATVLVMILYLTELYLIGQISYTMTAAFLAATGYVCLILRENRKERLIWFLLFELLAFLLRDKAMLMIQPLGFALYFGIVLIPKDIFRKKIRSLCEVILSLLLIVLVGFGGSKLGYSSDEWKLYTEYNAARTTLFDYNEFPPYEEVSHILAKYDVSENAYNAYKEYVILDWTLSYDCVTELADYVDNMYPKDNLSGTALLKEYVSSTIENSYKLTNFLTLCSYGCVVLFLLFSRKFSALLPILCLFFGRNVIWLYLLYEGRFPLRISMPLFACEILILITYAYYAYTSNKPDSKWKKTFSGLLMGLFCIAGFGSFIVQANRIYTSNTNHKIYMEGLTEILDYCENHEDNLYILDTLSFLWYNGEATDARLYGMRNCIMSGSWISNSPAVLTGNQTYLSDTKTGFYYILYSEDTTEEKMNHPAILYLAESTDSTPVIADTYTASHGGTYSIFYFEGHLPLKLEN